MKESFFDERLFLSFINWCIINDRKTQGEQLIMYKVILVDDEILVREAIGENVDWESLGYTLVQDCQNGKEAMEYLEENEVDLVLTDINMPYVDGLKLSEYIHENHPEIVVVIFSGYSEFEYAKKAIQYNVAEYLLKPVTPRELLEVLQSIKTRLDASSSRIKKMQKLQEVYTNYTKNESVLISNELSGLVQGTQEASICIRNLKQHGIELSGAFFRVAVMDIDHFMNGMKSSTYEKKESALMSFVVENISDEIIRNEQCGLAYRDKVGRVCILLYTNKPREFEKRIAHILEHIREEIFNSMKLSLSIAVGKYVQEIEYLYESYESALLMQKYQFIKGENSYFDYEKEKDNLDINIDMSAYLKAISNALKGENINSYMELCDEIKDEIGSQYIEESKAMTYLHQIVLQIYDTVLELCGEELDAVKERESVISNVANAPDLERAMQYICDYGNQVLQQLSSMRNTSGKRQALLAMSYLNEHYGDKDLGLATICSYLNISTSHFSSVYKEVTGETFMESLTKIRMEKAKQLLAETSLKNYEIADRVGFSDPHYFNIAFKKMTGKTPKAFAKENR